MFGDVLDDIWESPPQKLHTYVPILGVAFLSVRASIRASVRGSVRPVPVGWPEFETFTSPKVAQMYQNMFLTPSNDALSAL